MKLYYSRGACSLAAHIVLEELGLSYEAIPVDLRQEPQAEHLRLNAMGAVPTLVMDDGEPMTEVSAILEYLADLKPELALAPRAGTIERYRLKEWVGFVATEIHKGFALLWHRDELAKDPVAREEIQSFALKDLGEKLDVIVQKMGSQPFLMASGYTVADAYLFTVLSWARVFKMDLSRWPSIQAFMERVRARPAVMKALKAEHLA